MRYSFLTFSRGFWGFINFAKVFFNSVYKDDWIASVILFWDYAIAITIATSSHNRMSGISLKKLKT